jgi:hypothetical protein
MFICYRNTALLNPILTIADLILKRTDREIQQNAHRFGHSMIGKADFIFPPIKMCWCLIYCPHIYFRNVQIF